MLCCKIDFYAFSLPHVTCGVKTVDDFLTINLSVNSIKANGDHTLLCL